MTIGANAPIVDKLIKKTTPAPAAQEEQAKHAEPAAKPASPQKPSYQRPQAVRENATTNTVKMTFYVKQDLLDKLYNYAYWDRLTVTEALNTVLADGLKNKNTNPIKR
jgi:hypothetical protein